MKPTFKFPILILLALSTLFSCGGSRVLTMPLVAIENIPYKDSELTENELTKWSHLSPLNDTVPGMSVNLAYEKILKNNKGKVVIVAVIDSGIDIEHEDLQEVVWTNPNEIPNNGKDDDNNGYVDDLHGWNFIGDGYEEQLEYVRLLVKGDTINPEYKRAEKEYVEELNKYRSLQKQYNNLKSQYGEYKTNYERLLEQLISAEENIVKFLNKKEFTKDDVNSIVDGDPIIQKSISVMKYIYSVGFDSASIAKKEIYDGLTEINKDFKQIVKGLVEINDRLGFNLDKNLKGRKTGDNPDDLMDVGYGNNNVRPLNEVETHGTHVSGIIAAVRNNGIGINGVANNVKIMALRVIPNGDEYDKDVALAIKYAADNGAKVVNLSFGKYYSSHSDWVRDAIVYASKKDVLLVSGAGNEGLDLDQINNYPNDQINNGPEVSDNYLSIGAITPSFGSEMVADYSNYGKINVDIFAPGSEIYSAVPNNNYEYFDGTSMASPAVAGIASIIRSQYPDLTAAQVKHIILESGIKLNQNVKVGGFLADQKPFASLSKSGKIVNLYNALILASQQINQ